MKVNLEGGIYSLIAYYFKMTKFQFIDEYDFEILVNFANMCGIQVDVDDKDSTIDIFNQFLTKLDDFTEGVWHKGIVGKISDPNLIYNRPKGTWDSIRQLRFRDNFMLSYWNKREIIPPLIEIFNKMIGTDMNILMSKFPDSDTFKKYMAFKKIIICKTVNNHHFYYNLPSGEFNDSFDDWSVDDFETRGIFPQTYEFVENLEKSLLQLNESSANEIVDEPTTEGFTKKLA